MPIRKSRFDIHFEMVFLFENNFRTLSQNSSENKVFKVFSIQSCEKWFYTILSDFGEHLRDLQTRFSVEYFNAKRLSLTKGLFKIFLK